MKVDEKHADLQQRVGVLGIPQTEEATCAYQEPIVTAPPTA